MLFESELFILKPGFLFTPNPDILTHKHRHKQMGLFSELRKHIIIKLELKTKHTGM